jgi:O-methyltransferase
MMATAQTAVARAFFNSPKHAGRLAKAYAVLAYDSLYYWAKQTTRQAEISALQSENGALETENDALRAEVDKLRRQPGQCFSSGYIHLAEAARFADRLGRGYRDEHLLKAMAQKVAAYTMVSYEGVATLIDQVRYCEEQNIPGAFVEIGTCKGGCLGAMAHANLIFGRSRRQLHGFDSFEGIPKPRSDKDDMPWAINEMKLRLEDCDGSLQPANTLIAAQSDVETLFDEIGYPRDHLHLHVGWFQDTVPPAASAIGPIAILRLDGDLYDSYVTPLEQLWDLVVPGGFVVIDDWVLKGCREAVTDFFEKRAIRPYLSHVDQSVRYLQISEVATNGRGTIT